MNINEINDFSVSERKHPGHRPKLYFVINGNYSNSIREIVEL